MYKVSDNKYQSSQSTCRLNYSDESSALFRKQPRKTELLIKNDHHIQRPYITGYVFITEYHLRHIINKQCRS